MEKRTCDSIIEWFEHSVQNKEPIHHSMYLEAAVSLNVLLGEEHEKLFALEQEVAKTKLAILDSQEKSNVSEAKLRVEASDAYKEAKTLKAKIDRIVEFIRLAKVHARLADEEYHAG